jgi:hypothetical protein
LVLGGGVSRRERELEEKLNEREREVRELRRRAGEGLGKGMWR